MIINNVDISTKNYYRFIEFLSILCGINMPHERYKKIVFDSIEALSKEEKMVKSIKDSYLYISQSSEILGIPNIAVLDLFGIFLLKMPIFISF